MYLINGKNAEKIESLTFHDLDMREENIEELLRLNIGMICGEEESMLLVGQQVTTRAQARCDLIAVDSSGALVLIEVKRDKSDIVQRREALEFQAIRYAASCATVKTPDELICEIYAKYVTRHRTEYPEDGNAADIARKRLGEFLQNNNATEFNRSQRIVLVASDFDEQTLSAVAWLCNGKVDISCVKLIPMKIGEHLVIESQKILPVGNAEDYYIEFSGGSAFGEERTRISRRTLPRITDLMEWGLLAVGDMIKAKNREDTAVLNADGSVTVSGGENRSLQQWLQSVYGWASVATYDFSVDVKTNQTLSELRQRHEEQAAQSGETDAGEEQAAQSEETDAGEES